MAEIAAEDLIARLRTERGGSVLPELERAAQLDPAFIRAYADQTALVFNFPGTTSAERALPAATKELIAIALLSARQDDTTTNHVRRALSLGATSREVLEALEVGMQITGAPTLRFGLTCLLAIDEPEEP